MRISPVGALLALLLGACAHQAPRLPEARRLLDAELASRPACIALPHGAFASLRSNGVVLDGVRLANGGIAYPDGSGAPEEAIRRTYDLLAQLGLFTIEERPVPPAERRVRRHYAPTPAGAIHYRLVEAGHGATNWWALCYGARSLVALHGIGPLNRVSSCEATRVATYGYRYENIPAWADGARLDEIFPGMVTRRGAGAVRQGTTVLVGRAGHWFVDDGDPLVRVVCISD